jgi:arsenate reductase
MNVLFVCLQNAGRSQMSQALFEQAAAGSNHARSAGTTPAEHVHPEVVTVMRERGVDLADRTPKALTDDDARWADVVVTMGCGDRCPYIPGRQYLDWDLTASPSRPSASTLPTPSRRASSSWPPRSSPNCSSATKTTAPKGGRGTSV